MRNHAYISLQCNELELSMCAGEKVGCNLHAHWACSHIVILFYFWKTNDKQIAADVGSLVMWLLCASLILQVLFLSVWFTVPAIITLSWIMQIIAFFRLTGPYIYTTTVATVCSLIRARLAPLALRPLQTGSQRLPSSGPTSRGEFARFGQRWVKCH